MNMYSILIIYPMLKTAKMLTITVPKSTYATIRSEAKKRNETISGMLRKAFDLYISTSADVYSDSELEQLLQKDKLPTELSKDLARLTRKR